MVTTDGVTRCTTAGMAFQSFGPLLPEDGAGLELEPLEQAASMTSARVAKKKGLIRTTGRKHTAPPSTSPVRDGRRGTPSRVGGCTWAPLAQWQSNGLLIRRFRVRIPGGALPDDSLTGSVSAGREAAIDSRSCCSS